MPKKKISAQNKKYFKRLGKCIEYEILKNKKYRSLDQFSLEHHDLITSPSLYSICRGERDFQFSTISDLANALEIDVFELLQKAKLYEK